MSNTYSGKNINFLFRFLASGLFISYIPTAILKNRKNSGAGLWGTLLALAFVPVLPENPLFYVIFLIIFTIFSFWVSGNVSFAGGKHDDPKIVIDEIAGYWFAVMLLPKTPVILLASLVLFRFFDTLKPLFIKKLDKLGGAIGIVADDIASGVVTNVIIQIALIVLHYYNLKICV